MRFKKEQNKDSGNESKEERFKKIAGRRTEEVLDKLRLLGNCSNNTNYSYTDEQVKKIFSNIDSEIRRIKALYNKPKRKRDKFEL